MSHSLPSRWDRSQRSAAVCAAPAAGPAKKPTAAAGAAHTAALRESGRDCAPARGVLFRQNSRRFLAGLSLALAAVGAELPDHRGRQFIGWDDLSTWRTESVPASNATVLVSPDVVTDFDWREAVLSWNVLTPPGSGIKVEVRRLAPAPVTRFYVLGLWAADPEGHPRESVPGQQDEHGDVETDTLVLRQPARVAQVRLTLSADAAGRTPTVEFVGMSLLDPGVRLTSLPPDRTAWGRELAVPERTQVIYPEGISAWCSPTALSMLLSYWARTTARPDLDLDVPDVARAVNDPQWPGTGNWPFNTAFAGSFPGMRSYVARLSDVAELEQWTAAGVPLAVSVSYNLLRGLPRDRRDGHLVVVRGFTPEGEAIVNDPGTGKQIRRVFSREALTKAWTVSHNTVYIVHPVSWTPPRDRFGHWFSAAGPLPSLRPR